MNRFFLISEYIFLEILQYTHDADPGLQHLCVVAAMDKFTGATEILWRKRDGTATLSKGEHSDPCFDRLLLLLWAHYIEDGPHLLCTGLLQVVTFTENTGEDVANYIKKEGYLQM